MERLGTTILRCKYLSCRVFSLSLVFSGAATTEHIIEPIDAVMYALRWTYTIADVPSPTEHQFVVSTWRGCKRLLARPVQPKDPIEVSALHRLAADLESPTLMESRLLVLCLLCYSGALRIQEVLQIRVKDIVFSETSMRLFIPKRKKDQNRRTSCHYRSYQQHYMSLHCD